MFRSINTPIVPACASWWPMTIIWCAKASSSLSQRSLEHLVQVVAEATCAESVLTQLNAHEIDLLVLDLGMPGITGSRWIRARDPDLHIIVMTANQDSHARRGPRRRRGSLSAQAGRNADAAGRGQRAGAQACNARGRARRVRRSAACLPAAPAESLTRREQQILALIAAGATGTEVARRLYISPLTVRKHRENLMRKLEVHNTAELVAYAVRLGVQ